LSAWILGGWAIPPASHFLLPHPHYPQAEFVLLAPGATSDFVSSVPELGRALLLIAIALAIVEGGKALLFARHRYSKVLHVLAVIYQLTLALDILRKYVYDWFLYLLHVAIRLPLDPQRFFNKDRLLPIQSPWPSFFVLLVLIAAQLADYRRVTQESEQRRS
jgi:hypothetical protein